MDISCQETLIPIGTMSPCPRENISLECIIRAYHHKKKFSNNLVGAFFKVLRVIEINVIKCVLAENAFFLSNFCASFC